MRFFTTIFIALVVIITFAVKPFELVAQTGSLEGMVTILHEQRGVIGAKIKVILLSDSTKIRGGYSDIRGHYRIKNLSEGEYRIVVSSVGYLLRSYSPVKIKSNETTVSDLELTPSAVSLQTIVVSANRRSEKIIESPASVSVVSARTIAEHPAAQSPLEHIQFLAGVDYAQSGIGAQYASVRGGNGTFNGSLFLLSDYRISSLPSLRVNVGYLVPPANEDIDHIEIVRGPGAALYGPNVSQGILNIVTKSPFASQGTSISANYGERGLFSATARHAGTLTEKLAYKISVLYTQGNDWEYIDTIERNNRDYQIELIKKNPNINQDSAINALRIGKRDNHFGKYAAEGRIDYRIGENATLKIAGGLANALHAIEQVGIGAYQLDNWRFYYGEARLDYNDFFAQFYINKSNAGKTFNLRTGIDVVDYSQMAVGRIQNISRFGDDEILTYGADVFWTNPQTEGTIHGKFEDDDNVSELGGYVQSETYFFDKKLMLLGTVRIDKNNRLENPYLSPRAGLVYLIDDNNTLRLTYNHGFSTPAPLNYSLDILQIPNLLGFPEQYAVPLRLIGDPKGGLTFSRENGQPVFRSTFNPQGKNNPIPLAGAVNFWGVASQFVLAQLQGNKDIPDALKPFIAQFLGGINTPTPQQVGGALALLDAGTGQFNPISDVQNIDALKPTINQTMELGYKGIINEKFQFGVDVYYTHFKDFLGGGGIISPNVFLNTQQTIAYLAPKLKDSLMMKLGLPADQAEQLAQQIAGGLGAVPIGTVTPDQVPDPSAIYASQYSKNIGSAINYGLDAEFTFEMSNMFTLRGSYSYFDYSYGNDYSSIPNAPHNKAALGLTYYNDEEGLTLTLNGRYNGGFKAQTVLFGETVPAYALFDCSANYILPFEKRVHISLVATNIFDNKIQQLPGSPSVGRLVSLAAGFSF